jgi:hypothetical protein
MTAFMRGLFNLYSHIHDYGFELVKVEEVTTIQEALSRAIVTNTDAYEG